MSEDHPKVVPLLGALSDQIKDISDRLEALEECVNQIQNPLIMPDGSPEIAAVFAIQLPEEATKRVASMVLANGTVAISFEREITESFARVFEAVTEDQNVTMAVVVTNPYTGALTNVDPTELSVYESHGRCYLGGQVTIPYEGGEDEE